jgi:hypothetical protein
MRVCRPGSVLLRRWARYRCPRGLACSWRNRKAGYLAVSVASASVPHRGRVLLLSLLMTAW